MIIGGSGGSLMHLSRQQMIYDHPPIHPHKQSETKQQKYLEVIRKRTFLLNVSSNKDVTDQKQDYDYQLGRRESEEILCSLEMHYIAIRPEMNSPFICG